jgi:hypothetical protein
LSATQRRNLAANGHKSLAGQANDIDVKRGRVFVDGCVLREAKVRQDQALPLEQYAKGNADGSRPR